MMRFSGIPRGGRPPYPSAHPAQGDPAPASPPEPTWGPVVWTFFHVLAARIRRDAFESNPGLRTALFQNVIDLICRHLPCKDCRAHAVTYLSTVDWARIATKWDLQLFFYMFHEHVNQRTNKPSFPLQCLTTQYALRAAASSGDAKIFPPAVLAAFCAEFARRIPDISYGQDNTERARVAAQVRAWVEQQQAGDVWDGGATPS